MKCYFCQQECEFTRKSDGLINKIYACHAHQYLVEHWVSLPWIASTHQQPFDFYMVRVKWTHNEKYFDIDYLIRDSEFRVYSDRKLVFQFPFVPKITPEQFDTKIPVWISFS